VPPAAPPAPDTPLALLRTGDTWTLALDPVEVVEADGADAFDALDDLTPGFWAGFATFELGHAVEHVRPGRASRGAAPALPGVCFVRFAHTEVVPDALELLRTWQPDRTPVGLGAVARTSLARAGYVAGVERILDHIGAGDCYQVNLTRVLEWDVATDPVALTAAVLNGSVAAATSGSAPVPPHATILRLPGPHGPVAVVGASPERFLSWEGTAVETRPIKGTAAEAGDLMASAKDHAENVMIVDLARNDLGRVCRTGSVHVPALCATERHPGLAHLVSTVRGEIRDGVGVGGLLRATFPPASVTGAPKPRVLQIVEDLETVARGVYCGATGWIDTLHGRGDLAVAIRTFEITPHLTRLGVGAGIVADSDPGREWDETRLKAERLLAAAGAWEPVDRPRPGPSLTPDLPLEVTR